MMADNGYVMSVHADCAKYLCQTQGLFQVQLLTWYLIFIIHFLTRLCVCMYVCVYVCICVCVYICMYVYIYDMYLYIYFYTSRLAGKYMFNWEYIGICCYLTCISQHLPILSISTFSFYQVFFVVDVNQFLNYCKH